MTGTERPTASRRWAVVAFAGAVALLAVSTALVVVLSSDGDEDVATVATATTATTAPATTTTTEVETTIAPATTAPPTTESTTAVTEDGGRFATTDAVVGLGAGLSCADLAADGRSYHEVVDYWEHEQRPAALDGDANGVPCDTVYAPIDVDGHWVGFDGATALQRVVNALGWCGYRLDLGQVVQEGPFADGGFRVRAAIDAAGDGATDLTVDVEVFPGEVLPVDEDTRRAISCSIGA